MNSGFMEDEGRQRTTKFISHVFVEESDLRRQFEEEKAKSEKLSTFGNVSTWSVGQSKPASPGDRPSVEEEARLSETDDNEDLNGSKKLKTDSDSILKYLSAGVSHQSTLKVRSRVALPKDADKMSVLSENDCSLDSFQLETNISTLSTHSTDEDDGDVSVIEEIIDKASEKKETKKRSRPGVLERSRETYRLLKRRNIIIEAVKNLKLVESLFMLQKMIVEQEKQEGVSTKCCKKSILRLVHKLSQEGLVRLYRTTVIQDGISKKVELVVHPSINPSDPLVKSAIEQIRFRISNSTAGNRTKSSHGPLSPSKLETGDHSKGKTKESQNTSPSQNGSAKKVLKKTDEKMGVTELKNYHPVTVPGLGRTLGYLPKMPRLKITHIFFWYIVYGHHGAPQQQISHKKTPFSDITHEEHEKTEQMSAENIPDPENAETGPSNQCNNSEESLWEPEADRIMATVYVDDDSWKRFVPPVPIHEEFGHGWTLIGDILLCMPLSIFVQIVQVSYKVENLEDFLNHPIKKHTLIRYLPRPIRQQLLYKRRYIFSVFTSLQKLSCMGLVQFGPSERFQDRDQIFVYLKKKATIVDTTACDPHYNLAQGSHPFEKRFYNLITFQDVENFWFDLHFVCLNTPLGVVRFPRLKKANPEADDEHLPGQDLDLDQENKRNLERRCGILECTTGSREVVDDGSVPGDGMGAGGLDYSFYSHLKRNWVWISYIINKAKKSKAAQDSGLTRRLQTFLNKHPLPLCSGGSPKSVFGDVNLTETGELIQIAKEATENRNKRVCGGKGQKRKRPKKDAGKKAKKNKGKNNEQDKNRKCRYHDQADQSALQRMTRLRVTWSAQEDGLVMLCRIASNILNKKVKRPFVPWQVVRDILHYSLDESLDKTSHSVGRRARYFMKNPQTYLNYKVSLAEVYQDKCLVDDFMSRKQNYEDPKVCAGEFKEFVESLRQKFSTSLGRPASEIPDTVHELFDRYRVLAIGDESNQGGPIEFLNSVDDIHLLVLQNLILSTLALSDMQMKNYRSFQTFRIYREYKEEILVKAFLEFQNKRLVNRRRGNHTLGPKKSRALPFVPMSYHLSQTYYRFFTWRFPATICSESFEFLETLKAFGDADQADTFSFSDQENEAAADMMIFPLDGPGGQCVTILSMFLLGLVSVNVKIPDQIVVVDSNLVENEVIKSFGREGLDDEDYDDEEMDDTLGNKQKIEVKARQASHTNYLLMRGYCAPGIVSTRNLNPNDNVVVNACIVRVKLRCTPVQGRFKASGSVDDVVAGVSCLPNNFTQLLNFKDCSFSTFLTQCTETLGYSSADVSCVTEVQSAVEACSCFGIKMSDLGEKFIPYEELDAERTRCLQHYIQDLLTYEQVLRVGGISVRLVAMKHANPWLLHPESVKEQMTQSRAHFIKEAESEESAQQSAYNQAADVGNGGSDTPSTKALLEDEDPLSPTDVDKPKLSLMKENETTEEHIFAQTMHAGDGQNVPTDINKADTETTDAQQHAKELNDVVSCTEEKTDNTDTFKGDSAGTLPERESELYFLGRPWRVIDGSLNKPVCKGMMEAVLYHIMTKPGITKTSVLQYYSGVLQPVIVMELLQVLEHVGCIKKRYIETSSKVSLFSRTVIAEEIKNPKLCEDPTAFYEPTLDCTLRLGRMFPSEINWNNCPP
ncbi:general transcription factor 3C polypeptide 1 isoform X2 [Ascaphus truei]|uniref:general transcription factor 3C polypeptide 1 isoform X2 n=1 Tax=Ascaphus truei TaxID=8439 RepID=UPI003F59AE6B